MFFKVRKLGEWSERIGVRAYRVSFIRTVGKVSGSFALGKIRGGRGVEMLGIRAVDVCGLCMVG